MILRIVFIARTRTVAILRLRLRLRALRRPLTDRDEPQHKQTQTPDRPHRASGIGNPGNRSPIEDRGSRGGRTVCRSYVGYFVGPYVGTMSVFVGPYVGSTSGLCRYCVGTMSGVMSGPRASQGDVVCLRKGHLDPAWPTRGS